MFADEFQLDGGVIAFLTVNHIYLICKWGTFYGLPVRFSILSFFAPLFPINFLELPKQELFLLEATYILLDAICNNIQLSSLHIPTTLQIRIQY